MFDCWADLLNFHLRRNWLRQDVMAAHISASVLKQLGSMSAIENLIICVLMTDFVLYVYNLYSSVWGEMAEAIFLREESGIYSCTD